MDSWESARLNLEGQPSADLQGEIKAALAAHQQFGQLNPRLKGLHNDAIQLVKRLIRRSLTWYTRPNQLFQGAVIRAIGHINTMLQSQAAEIKGIRDQHALIAEQVEDLQSALRSGGDYPAVQPSADPTSGHPHQSRLLKENEKIIAYWDSAARNDPMRETVTQWANESDEEYLQSWKKMGEYVASKIMSYSPPKPVALEIGPGMGRITIPMSRYCQSITALDISPEMARCARETLADLKNLEVQVITDEDLSFLPSEHFDLAYSIACFQHADKKSFYRYLRGIRRALRPDGVLFFGVMNLCSEPGWKHFAAIVENDYPEFFHTPEEIACYLNHAGYSSHELGYEGETLWAIARP